MDRRKIELLIIGDDDLECKCDKVTLTELSIANTSFKPEDLSKIDLLVYKGKKGTKILKSNFTKIGKIG